MSTFDQVRADLQAAASPAKAQASLRFFKTGPGDYGEGDHFIGVTVPEQRKIARLHRQLPLADTKQLVQSPIHEERLTGLFILIEHFRRVSTEVQKEIYDFYLANTARINNWDLVDSSAEYSVGPWLAPKDRSVLAKL